MSKLLLALVFGVLFGAWEIAVRVFLPIPWIAKPLLALVILALIGSGRSRALAAAFGGALLLDLYTLTVFDFAVFRWIVLVFILDFLLQQVFTNRSLLATLALTFIARVFERGSTWIVVHLGQIFSTHPALLTAEQTFWQTLFWDGILVTLGFLLLVFFTKRLNASFYRLSSRSDIGYERF